MLITFPGQADWFKTPSCPNLLAPWLLLLCCLSLSKYCPILYTLVNWHIKLGLHLGQNLLGEKGERHSFETGRGGGGERGPGHTVSERAGGGAGHRFWQQAWE